ncbi:uncharacterized protein LOC134272825, partial [Saccostrea cucullata]|uniref:uncharacterized protein LOC134272825 n=1 Tax=Saccostrea cuccullata TaxID=36930 RepID=UPI002ED5974B
MDELGLCETFLQDHISDSDLSIDGYVLERKDRQNKAGGGIVIYISNDLSYKRRKDLEISNIETIWLEINLKNTKSILYCSAYRPPSAPSCWVEDLAREINRAPCCDDQEIILTGDFNVDLLKDPPQSWTSALEEFGLTQLITIPTRITNTSCTLIDHFYTTQPDNICEIQVPPIAISDHYPVCATRKSNSMQRKGKHTEIQYRDFKNFNEEEFLSDLQSANFNVLTNLQNPNDILENFYSMFNTILNKYATVKTKRVKTESRPKWFTPEINDARQLRDYYHQHKDFDNFRHWRNKVTLLINNAKCMYYKSAIEESSNPREMWSYLNHLASKSKNVSPTLIKDNESEIDDLQLIVNVFNEHFTRISDNLLTKTQNHSFNSQKLKEFTKSKLNDENVFSLLPISQLDDVLTMLRSLDINKSADVDFIGPRLLKLSANVISKPITHLINTSITNGIFPSQLKHAKVTPIYKKGDKSDPIWGNTSKCNIERIHKLQKRTARIILDAAPDQPPKPLFEKLGWLNVF